MFNPKKAEWGMTPETKELVEKLDMLIPLTGKVKDKKLEKFRKAQNVVYDIFNNGLCNLGRQLRVLGLCKYDLNLPYFYGGGYEYPGNWDQVNEVVEKAFTPIVMAAADEQGITL